MTNAELIKVLRCELYGDDWCDTSDCPIWSELGCRNGFANRAAAAALEAAEKRIDCLQKLVDINTERCEALRKQLMEAHENYEKHLNELEAQLPKEGEWIDGDARKVTARCSVCGHLRLGNGAKWANMYVPFCEICGAKMKGDNDEQIH